MQRIATSSRYWKTGSTTRNIQTVSYALLTQVLMNRLEYAGPIVVWLTKQRVPKGGFASTTDTSIALESLAKYSELAQMNKLDMKVWIKNKSKKINKNNALLQQEVDIEPYLESELLVETKGTGVGQMQVSIKYNVPSKKEDRCDFHLSVKITEEESGQLISKIESQARARPKRAATGRKRKGGKRKGGKRKVQNKRKGQRKRKVQKKRKCTRKRKKQRRKNCKENVKVTPNPIQRQEISKKLIVTICARYAKLGTTGMAIIDAGILTGYSVVEDSLTKLMKKENTSIELYELSDRAVVFYLDQIDSAKPLCVGFSVMREFNVGGIQPVPVKVYDYYKPDNSCTVFYNLGQTSKSVGKCRGNGICKCTQGKCPSADQPITNVKRMLKKICNNFDYELPAAIKGKVVLVDEDLTWLTYDVQVITVVKQGTNQVMQVNEVLEFRKQGSCINPQLEKGETVLVMGQRLKNKEYKLDNSVFVKKLNGKMGKGKLWTNWRCV